MLKYTVTKEEYDALPEAIKSEYKENGDSYAIQVDGMKTQADIDAVLEAKRKEKEARTAAESRVKELERDNGTLSDKVKTYESSDDLKLSAEERTKMNELQRTLETITSERDDLSTKYNGLEGEMTRGKIVAELSKSAAGIIKDGAIGDIVENLADKFVVSEGKVLTNSELGDKAGLDAKAYLTDFVSSRDYLQPTNSGAGAGGEKGSGAGSQGNNKDDGKISLFRNLKTA